MKSVTIVQSSDRKFLALVAWISVLAVSDLPDIVSRYAAGSVPASLFWYKISFLCLFLALCILVRRVSKLLPFAVIMLVFFLALAASDMLKNAGWWKGLIPENAKPSFFMVYLRPFARDIGVTLTVIAALFLIRKKRSGFFLVRGEPGAEIEPVPWLGIGKGESWMKFGWIFAIAASLIVAIPTFWSIKPEGRLLVKCIPLLPAVLFYAAINAFNEEIYFRSTLLSTLTEVIGKTNTLLINVVFFGLAHYLYGSPPGLTGALMTGFLAYLLGKAMLETKGFAWPWFIHFLPDVVIFCSYAILWMKQLP